jgi:hypothetical protein
MLKAYLIFITAFLAILRVGHVDEGNATTDTRKIIVYYFHGDIRCLACLNIERYTQEAVKTFFGNQLTSGTLEWRIVNFDKPGNEHYPVDYQLSAPSVILSEVKSGKEISWKNPEKIWEREADKNSFSIYIRGEIEAFYGKKQ